MSTVINRIHTSLATLAKRPDRGAETVEVMLWVAVIIVVVGGVGLILRNDLVAFFNRLVYDIGFTR
jgi:preprotein translocase subunit Sss1